MFVLSRIPRRFLSGKLDTDRTVLKIGSVRLPVVEAVRPELVPARLSGAAVHPSSNEVLAHLKWLLQKEILGQDVFLMGVPGSLRSDIVLQYLELCNREYEYLAVTRDTTEADIKQRREIRGGTAFYSDLCAVRAALHGRVLVLDGVEKAERNVLPILNNLLENREMQLEDGRFLMRHEKFDKLTNVRFLCSIVHIMRLLQNRCRISTVDFQSDSCLNYTADQLRAMGIERVSERFRIIALGLPVPRFVGNSLDPPLRSRFQCRTVPEPTFESTRRLCSELATNVSSHSVNDLVSMIYAINSQSELGISRVSMELIPRVMRIWNTCPSYSPEDMFNLMYPCKSIFKEHQVKLVNDFIAKFISEKTSSVPSCIRTVKTVEGTVGKVAISIEKAQEHRTFTTDVTGSTSSENRGFVPTPQYETLLTNLAIAHSQGDFALIGAKGAGKTKVIGELAARLGFTTETIVLYQSNEVPSESRLLKAAPTIIFMSEILDVLGFER
ncbi:hypothetical protein Y032_0013g2127 [Ancylostoma ceylanicum]|uniref:ATPase dynein-related AAA domain-containing protein n=1 Tax=Ancylostoma ceylanicum TaxID=53326 RepID=A0A016VBK9_9BILA|nr:hypothetical protein Y032_0013g2127 [Ancylostoma ceylanicum]